MLKTILIFILLVITFSSAFAEDAAPKEIVIGLIGEQPEKRMREYLPTANYIAEHLRKFNLKSGRVIALADINDAVKKIQNNEIDIIIGSAFSAVTLQEKADTIPSLLVWRKGVREYVTVFFVRKDSPIKTINDLKGKTIAFEDPVSTSAYIMPKAELILNGMTVIPSKKEKGSGTAVKYVFADEELNQAFWVAHKKADAGAFNNNDWDELPEKLREELKIIHKTKPIPRYIASFRKDIPSNIRKAIEDIFIGMDKTPEGRAALKSASNTKKIEGLTEKDISNLEYVRKENYFLQKYLMKWQ